MAPVTNPDLTTSEVAERLGVSVSSVHRLIARGVLTPRLKLPGVRGAYLFRRRDVTRLARQRGAA